MGSAHAFAAGEEAGVPYERVRLDLSAGEQKSAEFGAINPMAKVPALTDGTLWTGASPARRSRAPRRSRLLEFKMIGNSEYKGMPRHFYEIYSCKFHEIRSTD